MAEMAAREAREAGSTHRADVGRMHRAQGGVRLEYRAARVGGGAQRGVYGARKRVGVAEHDGARRPQAVSGEHGADVDLDDRPRLDLAAGTPEVGTD